MNKPCRNILHLSLLLSVAAAAPAKPGNPSEPESAALRIRLYDYAELSPAMMDWATKDAAKVLSKAGVPSRWLNCSESVSDEDMPADCRRSPSPLDLVLKIMPREMAERFTVPKGSFGFALLTQTKGRFGREAMVFYHRVMELPSDMDSYRSVVLGHLLAHEIGHLLLGSGSHSRRGIMKVTWQSADLERAVRGKMRFTPKQVQTIKKRFRERVRAAEAMASR